MVEEPQGESGRSNPDDGFEDIVRAFRSQAISLIGTMEVISQQAPLFAQSYEPGDTKRVAAVKTIVELTNKISKMDTLASKTMNLIFIGDPDEAENRIQSATE